MKKINFLMLVVAFVLSMTSVEAANVDRKYDVTNLIRISNELGGSLKEDTTSYSIELNKNINRLSDFLKLNRQQSDDIFDVHKVVMKQFAGLNLIKPFVEAVRKKGIKVGLYYSLPDWSHPDYPLEARDTYRYKNDSLRFKKFLLIQRGQLIDLLTQFNPDLLWFDGDWEHSAKEWDAAGIRKSLIEKSPNLIINSRLQGYGDYATPEQGLPVEKPKDRYWELCLTMNNSWGYQPTDNKYKSADQLIAILADCISMGGNLLLDIGPKEDGTIVKEQADILKDMGRWVKKHQKAIFGSRAGLPAGRFDGPTTFSSDGKTLYLFVPNHAYGWLPIKGLNKKIAHVKLVGDGTNLDWYESGRAWWSETPGIYYIYLPESLRDSSMSVIAVHLK